MSASLAMVVLRPKSANATTSIQEFDLLFKSAISDPRRIELSEGYRERQQEELAFYFGRPLAGRPKLATRKVSDRARDLIVAFEVTSKSRYTSKLQRPIWPHGRSGVTMGIGYDLGYVRKEWFDEDWRDIPGFDNSLIEKMAPACGLVGEDAKEILPSFSGHQIPWSPAIEQFRTRTLPRYITETINALPNSDALSDNSLGALVSLVYNRGASFKNIGDRYKEMRAIRLHCVTKKFERIPAEIRTMVRLWQGRPNMAGLLERRNLEATLFEAGL